jgi:hypothetical protein
MEARLPSPKIRISFDKFAAACVKYTFTTQ